MAPSKEQLMEAATQAQLDMNTYQAKTGAARRQGNDDAGVDTVQTEKRFPGASVKVQGDHAYNVAYTPEQPPKDPAYDDGDVEPAEDIPPRGELERKKDVLLQGEAAVRNNVGDDPPGIGGNNFRGSDYYLPEDVPDSISAESNVPPDSVTKSSAEAEHPDRFL